LEANVLFRPSDRISRVVVQATIGRVGVLASVDQHTGLTEVRFVAAVEVVIEATELIEIV
jgi:hypothetical protein